MIGKKSLIWVASSYQDILAFPDAARRSAGFQLDKIQGGHEPNDWKPFSTVGAGVCEIRLRDISGAFRVMYVAKFPGGIYVLHCFQKKTQATAGSDVQIARARYVEVLQREKEPK